MTEFKPRDIKGYRLIQHIGKGGFGAVYRATQLSVNREVAIKSILPKFANHPDFIHRFETEAQVVAHLEHPFIVPLIDYWREPNEAYLVMRFLPGGNLTEHIKNENLSDAEIISIGEQVASALDLAHSRGIVHRDIKPDNIVLDMQGNAFLTDFGIAGVSKSESKEEENGEEEGFVGSPTYMSPEQIASAMPHPKMDLFSLGIVLYEMLAGERPSEGMTFYEILTRQLNEPLPDIDDYPDTVRTVLLRATSKEIDERYNNASTMVEALKFALEGKILQTGTMPAIERVIQNPYKGLRAFSEADTANFFGRDDLVRQLVNRLEEDTQYANFLAVVGPSGSGKSSVVSAGLIPAIRAEIIPDSHNWFIVQMVPGMNPIESLKSSLLGIAATSFDIDFMHENATGLIDALRHIGGETLLVIDQFEEVFTLTESEVERAQFLKLLEVALNIPTSPLRLVITLRADFTDRPLHYSGIGTLMRQRTEFVLPLSVEELEQAITEPAKRMGLTVEPQLVSTILNDVHDEPGALPLLQYALSEVFEKREGNLLSLSAYRDSGGVLGSLARRAQQVYDEFSPTEQQTTMQIFLRLVTLGEGANDTRRRARYAELLKLSSNAENVLSAYGQYRLLTFDVEANTREPMVEVAHEALLRSWTLLQNWLDESRSDIRLQRWLASAANEWADVNRDESYLLSGSRLVQYKDWRDTTAIILTTEERDFLNKSIEQGQALEAEELARQERERRAAIEMRSMALSANARQNAIQNLPDIAIALSLEANDIPEPPDQVQQMLFELAPAPGTIRAFIGHTDTVWNAELSPDEKLIVSAGGGFSAATNFYNNMPTYLPLNTRSAPYSDNTARVWNLETGEEIIKFEAHTNAVTSVAFSADGALCISAGADGLIYVWDAKTGEEVFHLSHQAQVISIAVHENLLLASDYDFETQNNHIILWDLETQQEIRRLEGQADVIFNVRISPDGKQALSCSGSTGPFSESSGANDIILWDLETGDIIQRMSGHQDSVFKVLFRPNSNMAISSSGDTTIKLWDLDTGKEVASIAGHATFVYSLAVSPDGLHLFSASFDLAQVLWDIDRAQEIHHFYGHKGHVSSAKFLSDGRRMLTTSQDDTMRLWDVYSADEVRRFSAPAGMGMWAVASNGKLAITSAGSMELFAAQSPDNPLQLWDLETGVMLKELGSHRNTVFDATFLPDGKHYLTIGGDFFIPGSENVMVLRNIETDEEVRRYESPASAFSGMVIMPDGKHVATIVFGWQVMIWNIESGEVVKSFGEGTVPAFQAIDVTADGKNILTGSSLGVMSVWDAESGEMLKQFSGHTAHIYSVSAVSDNRHVVTSSDDTRVMVWDIVDDKRIVNFHQHTTRVQAVATAPNGKWVMTGDYHGNMLLWELKTGKVLRRFAGHTGAIWRIKFLDDNYVISTAADGNMILWHVDPQPLEELRQWTRANRMVRDFTCEERELYRIEPLCPESKEEE